MDIEQIARVVTLVENSQLHEVTIADGDQSIKVVNTLKVPSKPSHIAINDANNDVTSATVKPNKPNSKIRQVCATYVGQVYLSEDATTDDLIKEGDHIQKGQTVCFIDELTRLLPVVSDKSGIVTAILVESGQGVEYGQPIMVLADNT
ncbi:acetyl-CoA carboxylase biotin carboxyl carrier protein subunit [Psychrobacter sp. PP-21]|uniref:acetyl-CoA carboxylase biotin carboxyl carrier protein n=1 Tax=Psychrobacter sp. PP-21 TaxID=2957503 RepID=UPI0029B8F0F4|nr:biotin/lipoyl-containing protein [Psychrobacter sp. PP-21]MDX2374467.1 acetyl-CoA carboxylase biotin carboxyl carrier protein subunit [Psychrobacter sp. PP-21]